MPPSAHPQPIPRPVALVGVVIVVAAFALRVALAAQRSLWLDEFHSLFHARQASVVELLESLRRDNHPPLFFLLERASIALFGDGELGLRAPSIAAGVAHVALLGRAARRGLDGVGVGFAMALLAASALSVAVSAEARMYSLLALAVTGWVDALAADGAGRPRRWSAGAWAWIGFHAHYAFLHYAAVTALVSLASSAGRARLRVVAPGLAFAALASAPWGVWGFAHQLFASDLAPGGMRPTLARLAESYVHMQFHSLSTVGDPWRYLLLALAAIGLALAAASSWRWLREDDANAAAGGLWIAAAWLVPPWCAVAAIVFSRSGFNWTYLAPSVAPFALLMARASGGRGLARVALGAVLAGSTLLSFVIARSPGMEDYRGAVARLLAEREPADALIVAEPGPAFFPRNLGFHYYAKRLSGDNAPTPIDVTSDYRLADDSVLDSAPRAWLFHRGLGDDAPLFATLRRRYSSESSERFGWSLTIVRFERAP